MPLTSSQIVRFKNVKLVKDGKLSFDDLWIKNGLIINPEPLFYDEHKLPDLVIDCKRMIIAPGYIDVQINGMQLTFILS